MAAGCIVVDIEAPTRGAPSNMAAASRDVADTMGATAATDAGAAAAAHGDGGNGDPSASEAGDGDGPRRGRFREMRLAAAAAAHVEAPAEAPTGQAPRLVTMTAVGHMAAGWLRSLPRAVGASRGERPAQADGRSPSGLAAGGSRSAASGAELQRAAADNDGDGDDGSQYRP